MLAGWYFAMDILGFGARTHGHGACQWMLLRALGASVHYAVALRWYDANEGVVVGRVLAEDVGNWAVEVPVFRVGQFG